MTDHAKIIIAEDSLGLRKFLVHERRDYGITTIGEASNGQELLHELKSKTPDLILLDLKMPVMTGKEVFEIIRRKYPQLRIAILSNYKDESLIINYIERGAKAFLPKNYITQPFKLANAILDIKERGHYLENFPLHALKFTKRETEIIPLIIEEKTNKEIAHGLNIGYKVITKHKKNILRKTQSKSVKEFINSALKKGLQFLGRKN
jgi:DNA-binding NarL/FixJ family response regulator